jgi:hypothetical protein
MAAVFLVPVLTPHGHLSLTEDVDANALDPELAQRLRDAFARRSVTGCSNLAPKKLGV